MRQSSPMTTRSPTYVRRGYWSRSDPGVPADPAKRPDGNVYADFRRVIDDGRLMLAARTSTSVVRSEETEYLDKRKKWFVGDDRRYPAFDPVAADQRRSFGRRNEALVPRVGENGDVTLPASSIPRHRGWSRIRRPRARPSPARRALSEYTSANPPVILLADLVEFLEHAIGQIEFLLRIHDIRVGDRRTPGCTHPLRRASRESY